MLLIPLIVILIGLSGAGAGYIDARAFQKEGRMSVTFFGFPDGIAY